MEINICLTDDCNFCCSYCYEGKKKTEYLDKNKIENILKFISSCDDEKYRVAFHGGEPLLNKEGLYVFFDVLHKDYKGLEKKIIFSMTTNGSLLDRNIIDFLCINNVDVSISIDGDMKTHLLNRHVKSGDSPRQYENIIKNLKLYIEKNDKISVRMTLTPNNVEYFSYNIEYFISLGVKRIFFAFDRTTAWSKESLEILDCEVNKVFLLYLKNRLEISFPNIDGWIDTFIVGRENIYCNAGTKGHLVVAGDGCFYPCAYVVNKECWKLGNLEEGYKEEKFREAIKNNIVLNNNVKNCEMAFLCIHGKCGFLNYIITGYLNKCPKQGCDIQKIIYENVKKTVQTLYISNDYRISFILKKLEDCGKECSDAFNKYIRGKSEEE